MLHTHWSAEAWSQVRVEFRRALALRSEIRRAGWFSSIDGLVNNTGKEPLLRYDPVFSAPRHLDTFPTWLQPSLDGQPFIKEIFYNNGARIPK